MQCCWACLSRAPLRALASGLSIDYGRWVQRARERERGTPQRRSVHWQMKVWTVPEDRREPKSKRCRRVSGKWAWIMHLLSRAERSWNNRRFSSHCVFFPGNSWYSFKVRRCCYFIPHYFRGSETCLTIGGLHMGELYCRAKGSLCCVWIQNRVCQTDDLPVVLEKVFLKMPRARSTAGATLCRNTQPQLSCEKHPILSTGLHKHPDLIFIAQSKYTCTFQNFSKSKTFFRLANGPFE